jgi:hypothetical protein
MKAVAMRVFPDPVGDESTRAFSLLELLPPDRPVGVAGWI